MAKTWRNLNFDTVAQWPSSARWALFLTAFFSVVLVGYALDTESQRQYLAFARSHEHTLQYQLQGVQLSLDKQRAKAAELTRARLQFSQLVSAMPKKALFSKKMQTIAQLSAASGAKLESLSSSPENHHDYLANKTLKMSLTGNYAQLSKFVQGFDTVSLPVRFSELNMSPDKKGWRMQLTAQLYRHNVWH